MPSLNELSFDDYIHPGTYPLVSIASADVWWVAVPDRSGITIWRTADAGKTWSRRTTLRLAGQPDTLRALGSNGAWMTELVGGPNHRRDLLFVTADGGKRWHRVAAVDGPAVS
jgi:photosystem II stability/assembly factor-like uncharacterized protein